MSLVNYKQLLSELGQSTGIPGLTSDNDNYCCLGFDDKIIVHLQFNSESEVLMFFCQLGKVDEDKAAVLYPRLLKANLFWQGTGGATIGVNDESGEILMGYQASLMHMDFPMFQKTLERFINTAELWINTLEAFHHAEIPTNAGRMLPGMHGGIKA